MEEELFFYKELSYILLDLYRKWLATVLIQSSELFLALEKVLRWLETVLTWG